MHIGANLFLLLRQRRTVKSLYPVHFNAHEGGDKAAYAEQYCRARKYARRTARRAGLCAAGGTIKNIYFFQLYEYAANQKASPSRNGREVFLFI